MSLADLDAFNGKTESPDITMPSTALLFGGDSQSALAPSVYTIPALHDRLMANGLVQRPAASVTPAANGDVVFELTSNTSITIKAKGSDGVVRSAVLTLV